LNSTKDIFTTAGNIGYIEAYLEGKPFGVVHQEILKEGSLLFDIYTYINTLEDSENTDELKKLLNKYEHQRELYDKTLKNFTSNMVFMVKEKNDVHPSKA